MALTLMFFGSLGLSANAEEAAPTVAPTTTVESPLPIESAYVEISPEYSEPADWPADQPSVVIYNRIVLENDTDEDYTGEITISVPANSGAFAFLGVGEHEKGSENYESTPVENAVVDETNNTVTFTPTKPIKAGDTYDFNFSYVYNPITFDGTTKSLTYTATAPTDINQLSVVIYTPAGASNPDLAPTTTMISPLDSGEVAYQYTYSGVGQGEAFTFDISYDKADLTTTQEASGQTSSGTSDTATATSSSGGMSNGAALMISASIIIFGVLVFLGLRGRGSNKSSNSRSSNNSNKSSNKSSNKPSKPKKAEKTIKNDEGEKKRLRKQLLDGEITTEDYERQMKKLK